MGRPKRIDYEGAWHHVFNRGARRQPIFLDDEDRRWFLELLAGLYHRFGVEVHEYCLMGNHYHLLVRCETAALSDAMQHLGTCYVRRFNRRHGFDGPLFRGRFGSVLIRDEAHLAQVRAYIHRNPEDIGEDPETYPWSSYGAQLGNRRRLHWLRGPHPAPATRPPTHHGPDTDRAPP